MDVNILQMIHLYTNKFGHVNQGCKSMIFLKWWVGCHEQKGGLLKVVGFKTKGWVCKRCPDYVYIYPNK